MKTTQLAVVWPIPELPQNTNQIHQEIWTRTANLLKPGLGYPAERIRGSAGQGRAGGMYGYSCRRVRGTGRSH